MLPPHDASSWDELTFTTSPANDGLVSTWITAATKHGPNSASGFGLAVTVILGGSPAVPPPALPPLLQLWVLWQPLVAFADATTDIPSRGRLTTTAMAT